MSQAQGSLHPSRGWFVLLVLIVVLVAVAAVLGGTIVAAYLLAGAMLVLGLLRLALPSGSVGPLVVRSRWFDTGLAVAFAVAIAFVAHALPAPV